MERRHYKTAIWWKVEILAKFTEQNLVNEGLLDLNFETKVWRLNE